MRPANFPARKNARRIAALSRLPSMSMVAGKRAGALLAEHNALVAAIVAPDVARASRSKGRRRQQVSA